MSNSQKTHGSKKFFGKMWCAPEAQETYFSEKPVTQMQLFYKQLWLSVKEQLERKRLRKGRSLEAGCGRGTLSLYLAKHGFNCTLLDCSREALKIAEKNFLENNLKANFIRGDVEKLPFKNNSFDVVASVGLLEHFADVSQTISEQTRVLKPGGLFIAYVAPKKSFSMQTLAKPINKLLGIAWAIKRNFGLKLFKRVVCSKEKNSGVFRTDFNSHYYVYILRKKRFLEVTSFGVNPFPWIHPLPTVLDLFATKLIEAFLSMRKLFGANAWICNENWGSGFLLFAVKPKRTVCKKAVLS